MSLFVFAVMAFIAFIALIWQIKVCEIIAMACAPTGALFTCITLITGSLWGKATWGTYWDWDPRLTSELILLFLYLGIIGLYQAIEDPRQGARAAGFLSIVGLGLLPIIHYSVYWWYSLHQGQTVTLFGPEKMYGLGTLLLSLLAYQCWFIASVLHRARVDNMLRAAQSQWVRNLSKIS